MNMTTRKRILTLFSSFVIMTVLFLALGIWISFQNAKPKTANDLINKMTSEEAIADLAFTGGAGTEEHLDLLAEYRFVDSSIIDQFFIVDIGENEILLVQTTAGLIDNQLYIEDVKEISREDLSNLLSD